MQVQFHVLASGSAGNACVLDAGGFGLLIDFGLPPRLLEPRLRKARLSWNRIDAVILTHTHTDHWRPATLTQLATLRVPIYCHAEHAKTIDGGRRAFAALSAAGLIRYYEPGKRVTLHPKCQCVPIAVDHDDLMTCGFRFEGMVRGVPWAIAYAADLGSWQPALAAHCADVDLLALEFNHDVPMQLGSGRHPLLIRRVLGDSGHLSNEQAAALLAAILKASAPGRLKHLVQLHLSQDCNRADLAETAARQTLERLGVEMAIHTTDRRHAGPSIALGQANEQARNHVQPMLPFAD
jgi:phosphoribosyl 1,2-cyclic phosphodiesterase